MRIGIMGGTFDPIHIGHLIAAESAKDGAALDEVWFIPSYVPPHKSNAPSAAADQRWNMVCLATANNASYRSVDLELQMGGVSYSIDTVTELMRLYPEHSFFYIIGGDMVDYLPEWHRIDELVRLIGFIGLARPGYLGAAEQLPGEIAAAVTMIEMPSIDISSTWIRSRCAAGLTFRYTVPEAVHDYIKERRLYES